MNMKFDLKSIKPMVILTKFLRIMPFLAFLVTVGAIGFSLWRLEQVVTIVPDPVLIAAERDKVSKAQIKFDTKTIDAVNKLKPINTKIDLTNLGKPDPFSP